MAEHADDDVSAPCWDAIDASLKPLHGEREPLAIMIEPTQICGDDGKIVRTIG
jgi:hypothetical protein